MYVTAYPFTDDELRVTINALHEYLRLCDEEDESLAWALMQRLMDLELRCLVGVQS